MVFSGAKNFCWTTLTLGILIGLGGRANAASIVQTVNYVFTAHGTNVGYYSQFDTSLGTLSDVIIQCQGDAMLINAVFANYTTMDQTFTGSTSFGLNTDGGSTDISSSLTLTLQPGQATNGQGVSTAYDLSTSYARNSFWEGTGQLGALQYAAFYGGGITPISPVVQSDNPNITIFIPTSKALKLSPICISLLGMFRSRRHT